MSTNTLSVGKYTDVSDNIRNSLFKDVPKGWRVVRCGVPGNGSCYYHSLAFILNFDNMVKKTLEKEYVTDSGHKLRDMSFKTLNKNKWDNFWKSRGVNKFQSFEQLQNKMKDNSVWADLWACVYTFSILNLDVIFLDINNDSPYCGVTGARNSCSPSPSCAQNLKNLNNPEIPNANGRVAAIAWVNHSHFEPIVLLKSDFSEAKALLGRGDDALKKHVLSVKNTGIVLSFSGKLKKSIIDNYNSTECKKINLKKIALQNL